MHAEHVEARRERWLHTATNAAWIMAAIPYGPRNVSAYDLLGWARPGQDERLPAPTKEAAFDRMWQRHEERVAGKSRSPERGH